MVDVAAVVEPVPTGNTADLALTVDPFVAAQVYEIGSAKEDFGGADFNLVAFDPLNQGLIASSETTIVLDMNLTSGTLDPNQVTIQLNGSTIYLGGAWFGEFTNSSVVDQGGGVYRFTLVKAAAWTQGSTQELRVFPPGESP